jgi:putative transposase
MEKLQAFKFKIEPNGSQRRLMTQTAGACRFVYNKMLATQNERYENGEKRLSYADSCKFLTEWKKSEEMSWLSLAPAQSLQQSLRHLERGFKNYFSAFAKAKNRGTLGKVPLDFEHPTEGVPFSVGRSSRS